jgi:D-alanine--poly(phosphoribitol) ligase subunit 2
LNEAETAGRIEAFVRETFDVSPGDPGFSRDVDLFDGGYVDSVGFTELLAFIEEQFGIEVPEDELLSDEFLSIDGMGRVLARLSES